MITFVYPISVAFAFALAHFMRVNSSQAWGVGQAPLSSILRLTRMLLTFAKDHFVARVPIESDRNEAVEWGLIIRIIRWKQNGCIDSMMHNNCCPVHSAFNEKTLILKRTGFQSGSLRVFRAHPVSNSWTCPPAMRCSSGVMMRKYQIDKF